MNIPHVCLKTNVGDRLFRAGFFELTPEACGCENVNTKYKLQKDDPSGFFGLQYTGFDGIDPGGSGIQPR